MTSKRKALKEATAVAAASKKSGKKHKESGSSTKNISIADLYAQCISGDASSSSSLDKLREWEDKGAITEIVWPFLASELDSKEYHHGCHLLVALVAYQFWEGSYSGDSNTISAMVGKEAIQKVLETLLYETDKKDFALQSQIVNFLTVAMASNNKDLQQEISSHLGGLRILHWIPERRRELELKKSAGLRRNFVASQKGPMWIVQSTQLVLSLLEGHSEFGPLVNAFSTSAKDAEDLTTDVPLAVWIFLHKFLDLLVDLLSSTSTRLFLVTYLDSVHFNVRCRLAVGHRYATPENLRLIQHMLGRINGLLKFPYDDVTKKHLSKVNVVSMHHLRASILQKIAYRHYADDLKAVIYAGVGLLCGKPSKNSYLERCFVGFSDAKLMDLLYKMRLVSEKDPSYSRNFLLQVLSDFLAIPPYPIDQIRTFPLYPTESLLWDHSIIPPSSSQMRATQVLALPKLNSKFISFQDYLRRNYELIRLESAYEIRADLVNVIKRLQPVLRQTDLEDGSDIQVRTEFNGWSRMAMELAKPFRISEVRQPNLGDTISSRVTAEINIDLAPCGAAIRREWDEIGEFDNLFLVEIDASKMSGREAPLLKDYHLHHGSHKVWDSDSERRVTDEEDSTFCERFGIQRVRGCMVYQVQNESGTILSEPGTKLSQEDIKSTKRVMKVVLDSAQYAVDSETNGGSGLYQNFNLVVRRHGRENNFKAVLETIRGLLEGAASIDRVVPEWLQGLVLGQSDPASASYKSNTMKQYALKTVGVNKPTDFLDFGDTFLEQQHLEESFNCKVNIQGREKIDESSRKRYKIRFLNNEIEAIPMPHPEKFIGNPVRFTPVQVEAIRSGLLPGLTLVVGPPGTGKTDVAVQIISNLYHTYPTQRTIIITHSNAALNDIFSKVMARGDIDERYFVRLGAGEKDLVTDSSHDFTKIGRVAYSIQRRDSLLEQVQQLSESLGISGKAQRGADGSPSYTCETADYFYKHQILRRQQIFENFVSNMGEKTDESDVSTVFPFSVFFNASTVKLGDVKDYFSRLAAIFSELSEYRPFELLRSQRQRADYLITKQARIVAMTCTHAAIARSSLINLGFEYDNIVVEESGQMLEIESFIPCLLQKGKTDDSVSGVSRLKRVCMLGDHNQLPPVVKNSSFSKFSNLDQSLFTRLIRLGVPYVQLDKQGRARSELMKLYSWRYNNLGSLDHVTSRREFQLGNSGLAHSFQLINVEDFDGKGETTPTPFYYQNLGEAEYAVALFQYMVLIGYSPERISILTTYNGQKELISDILRQRCGVGTPLAGVLPKSISTVDQYQGQQNDIILLSLVRTKTVGHLRDIRRLIVAVSRARLGLYVFCRQNIFCQSHDLRTTMTQFLDRPTKLQLVLGETASEDFERKVDDAIPQEKIFNVEDVSHLGSIVHSMQEDILSQNQQGEEN